MNNNLYTIGVEEEYMICDSISGDLINKADLIMNSLNNSYIDRFSYELILSEIEDSLFHRQFIFLVSSRKRTKLLIEY